MSGRDRRGAWMVALALIAPFCTISAQADGTIRAARARSNAAIARHDTAGIAAEWMPNVNVVSSAGLQLNGRAENARALQQQFTDRPDVIYVRTPDSLQVYPPWGMAAEFGHWQGSWTQGTQKIEIGGAYFAKWQRESDRWLIQAEVFVPAWCRGGSFCDRRP
ncbi:MAG: nuclear transport factor 2 family protein [Gemmatimonadaceae bacterium]